MRAGCQVGTKADELLQGAPRVPPSEVLPLPDTPDTPVSMYIIHTHTHADTDIHVRMELFHFKECYYNGWYVH